MRSTSSLSAGVGRTQQRRPVEVFLESLLEFKVAHVVTAGVEVEQAIEAHGLDRADIRAQWGVLLQASASAYAHHLKLTELFLLATCGKVYVGKGIELVYNDIDVITAYACTHNAYALALVGAGYGTELARRHVTLLRVEEGCNLGYTVGVANKYDLVGQLIGFDTQVIDCPVRLNKQFRGREIAFHIV